MGNGKPTARHFMVWIMCGIAREHGQKSTKSRISRADKGVYSNQLLTLIVCSELGKFFHVISCLNARV